MHFISVISGGIIILLILLVGGMALEAPLEFALASADGPERIPLLLLQVFPKLAHLILDVLSRL